MANATEVVGKNHPKQSIRKGKPTCSRKTEIARKVLKGRKQFEKNNENGQGRLAHHPKEFRFGEGGGRVSADRQRKDSDVKRERAIRNLEVGKNVGR